MVNIIIKIIWEKKTLLWYCYGLLVGNQEQGSHNVYSSCPLMLKSYFKHSD